MRTRMNAIVAFSFLMKENCCNNSEREEFSDQVSSLCEQLIELFEGFLDSAIIDTGNSKAKSVICKLEIYLMNLFQNSGKK